MTRSGKNWACRGIKRDGTVAPTNGNHPLIEVNGDTCPECLLSRSDVVFHNRRRLSISGLLLPASRGSLSVLLTSLVAAVIAGIATSLFLNGFFQRNASPLEEDNLNIGVISLSAFNEAEPYREALKKFIREEIDPGIDVDVDIIRITPGETTLDSVSEELDDKLGGKEWDIFFGMLPTLSFEAYDNEYEFIATMFFREPSQTEQTGIFFVRNDSSIRKFEDITESSRELSFRNDFSPEIEEFINNELSEFRACQVQSPSSTRLTPLSTGNRAVVALGAPFDPASSFTFYSPLYHFFGATFFADYGNSPCQILKKVLLGQAHVGASIPAIPFVQLALEKNLIRTVSPKYEAKVIPYPGVFLSSDLVESDREFIRQTFEEMPEELAKDLHFLKPSQSRQPDYGSFSQVNERVEKITECADWERSPAEELTKPVVFAISGDCEV